MVDGSERAQPSCIAQQRIYIGNVATSQPEVEKIRCPEKVDVALKGGDFAAGNQQQLVEVGLQLAHRIVVRRGVVIRDSDEVQAAPRRRIRSEKDRAGNHLA